VVEDLDTQQHVVNLDIQDAEHLVYALQVSVGHGLIGALVLVAQELELELVL